MPKTLPSPLPVTAGGWGHLDPPATLPKWIGCDGFAGLVAYNIACSYARLGECDRALGWLATSVREGYHDAALLDGDEDLNALRADPRFSQIRTRLGAADA